MTKQYNGEYIEFIGLPGASEASFLNFLIESGLTVNGRKEEIIKVAFLNTGILNKIFSLRLLLLQLNLFISLLKFSSCSSKSLILKARDILYFFRLLEDMKRKQSLDGKLIQDQGLVQALASLLVPDNCCNTITLRGAEIPQNLLKVLEQLIDFVCVFNISVDDSIARIALRHSNHSRADRSGEQQRLFFLEQYQVALSFLVDEYWKTNIKIIQLDAMLDLINKKEALQDFLSNED